jgi:hypothetical protein
MITNIEAKEAQERVLNFFEKAYIVLTPEEKKI